MTALNFIKTLQMPLDASLSGSLLSVAGKIDAGQKQDVVDCLKLASIGACRTFDKFTEAEKWYREFSRIMTLLGWKGDEFTFSAYIQDQGFLHIDRAALGVMTGIADPEQLARIQESLECLKDPVRRPDLNQFEKSTLRSGLGNFRLCSARAVGSDLQIVVGAFHFKSEQASGPNLFDPWSAKDMSFYLSAGRMTLDQKVHGSLRPAVKAKLAGNAIHFSAINPIGKGSVMRLRVA